MTDIQFYVYLYKFSTEMKDLEGMGISRADFRRNIEELKRMEELLESEISKGEMCSHDIAKKRQALDAVFKALCSAAVMRWALEGMHECEHKKKKTPLYDCGCGGRCDDCERKN